MKDIVKTKNGYRIKSLIGGFHLKGMIEEDIVNISETMKGYDIRYIYTGHCTGIDEYGIMKRILGDRVSYLTTSSSIII
ncbi:hypothetical protein [Thermoanaerobacterium saccharolyticum]|uniref:hypothetical protein n=1 Tax=Thermoanaerobacterium saccharolyticum TaxID=28896 RepID=UPI002FDB019B